MPTRVGNTSMDLVPSREHGPRCKLFVVFVALICIPHLLSSAVNAEPASVHEYYLQEPVFGGKARVVEAGRDQHPLIVLVHGLNDSADVWRTFIPSLSQHFHVISFDLPGFGHSSKANKLYSPDNYVKFIRFVVSRFRHQQMILVGHSMGANIALRYASIYPQQVERLVLVDAAGILHRLTYTQFLTHYGIQALPKLYPEQESDLKLLAKSLFGVLTDYAPLMELGEYYVLSEPLFRQNLLGGYPPAIAAHAMLLTDYSSVMADFRVPTLILWGEQDQITPLRIGKVLAANLHNAGLVVFANAGHNPMLDQGVQFAQQLEQFVRSNPQARDAMLEQHRYRVPAEGETGHDRIGQCHKEQNKVFRGRYKLVVIEQCQNVLLQDLVAESVTVIDSQARFENCRLQSRGKSLLSQNSRIQITACRIQGSPAIELANTQLDMAGTQVASDTDAVKAGKNTSLQGQPNNLLFSVSKLTSRYQTRSLHGPVTLHPGQGL